MIATLHGVVSERLGDMVVVDCAGVGYGVLMTTTGAGRVGIGEEIKVYIYEHIKEDAYTLIGFTSVSDKQLFEQLLGVKNVGPRVAMSILDIGPADGVRASIASGDVKRLQTAKGVGKRAAEQIVVELRDKVGMLVSDSAEDIVNRGGVNLADEAIQALIALGYSEADAALALKNIDPSLGTEQRIKEALRPR